MNFRLMWFHSGSAILQLTIKNITELLYKKTNHLVLIEWRELYSARRERELQSKGLGGKKQVTHPNHLEYVPYYAS